MYSLLIVDDEPLTREYMRMNISSINSSWLVAGEAEDGAEALKFLEKQPVDLVITDIKMPVMDGLNLCKMISQKYPRLKVLILSGYDEFAYAKEAMLYGVSEYLLKPIVKEDLRAALDNVARKLESEKNNELTYNSILNLSKDSKKYVVRKFLQALIDEATVEIKSLYPLIYRMKVSLIEGEGIIMILSLDEGAFLHSDLPVSDISIYKYILNQVTTEMVEESDIGWTFLDSGENTCVLISGEDTDKLQQACINLRNKVNAFMSANTGLTIIASIGSLLTDILQLSQSYKAAYKLLTCSLLSGETMFFSYNEKNILEKLVQVDKVIEAAALLKSSFIDKNEIGFSLALSKFIDLIDYTTVESILRCGMYVIKNLSSLKSGYSSEFEESVMKQLKHFSFSDNSDFNKENVIKLYKALYAYLSDNNSVEQAVNANKFSNDANIVEKAKDYIFYHYSEPISLALIAENVGVSSSYLSQLFHKTVGESYIQFLTRVRMEQAGKLLKAYPEEKISKICEKVGYIGVKHFTYVFKQYFNKTPGEYQNSK